MHNLLALCFPSPDNGTTQCVTAPNGIPQGGMSSIGQSVITNGIGLFLVIAVIIAIIFMIYSGIQWIQSGGDKQKIQAARNRLTFTIIGLVLIFLTFFIISVVGYLLGINLLNPTG